jgi:hypothetical protein
VRPRRIDRRDGGDEGIVMQSTDARLHVQCEAAGEAGAVVRKRSGEGELLVGGEPVDDLIAEGVCRAGLSVVDL